MDWSINRGQNRKVFCTILTDNVANVECDIGGDSLTILASFESNVINIIYKDNPSNFNYGKNVGF